MARSLLMPNPSSDPTPITNVEHNGVVVIVGANGTGKSRLGHWLEARAAESTGHTKLPIRRLSAHRMIVLPDQLPRMSLDQATTRLEWGNQGNRTSRVEGDPVVGVLNDFQFLLEALFAARDAQALEYMETSSDETQSLVRPKPTVLEKAKKLWEKIFPERHLIFGDYRVEATTTTGSDHYPATQLSDGERVGLYLIGHALLAPKNSTLLVDEPELHLHESLQAALWDALEAERHDCSFIYITHDLEFAASRIGAPKLLLKGYKTGAKLEWEWSLAPEGVGLPEDVVLRIVGSRRPTLFVEGLSGSIDHDIYQGAYPGYYVVPSGSCEGVIRSVNSFREHESLHRYSAQGIIDRDDRDAAQIAALSARGVQALPYAQAENILAAVEVMEAFSKHVKHPSGETPKRIEDAKDRVLQLLVKERDATISQRALYGVERRIGMIELKGTSSSDLITAVTAAVATADPAGVYTAAEKVIDAAITNKSYEDALTVLRNKGVLAAVAQAMGARVDDYRRIATSLIREDKSLRKSLSRVLPNL